MKWDAEADRRLLIFGFGREIRSNEYKIIADQYEQKPTVKAIQERITKIRVEVRKALKETGIFDPERVAQPPPTGGAPPRGPATPGQGMSSPAPGSAKKPTSAKKGRPASGGPKSKPPGAGTQTPGSQPPPGSSVRPSSQPPSGNPPAGPAWGPRFPPGSNPQIGTLPMGRPLYGGLPPFSVPPRDESGLV